LTPNSLRRIHATASATIGLLGLAHSGLTALFYSRWSANAAWFLGAGLGLTLLAALNWAALDENPRGRLLIVTRSANWVFAVFTLALVWAVPQPQAVVIATGVLVQAVVGQVTLKR
jgi:hypothetical protein